MRKNVLICCLFIFAVVFTAVSCTDAIFYTIHQEVEPIDPFIKGAPSSFVIFKNDMYVASGSTIYRYTGSWDTTTISPPGGRILQIASTKTLREYLYALCFTDTDSGIDFSLRRFDGSSSSWETLGGTDGYNSIQYIFAANDVLFIGAKEKADSDIYTVLYVDRDEKNAKPLINNNTGKNTTGEISGASFAGNYYISTRGNGIFSMSNPASGATPISNSNRNFLGMISLNNNTIALITRGGEISTVTGSNYTPRVGSISFSSRFASGALAIWKNGDNMLLLAGRQDSLDYTVDSGYTYGYMELELNSDGTIKSGTNFVEPGTGNRTITTTADNDRFLSTIGKHPVNHIFQASDGILFAATQRNGVWSYRDRKDNGGYQWNAEAEE